MGALDNTIVMFLSDNGASPEQILRGDGHDPAAEPGSARSYLGLGAGWSTAANTPFRLHKSWTHEGGICTPLIVHWPAGIKDRNALRTPARACGGPGSHADGTRRCESRRTPSTASRCHPCMAGAWCRSCKMPEPSRPTNHLWFYHDGHRAIRVGDWKLVAKHQSPPELYQLADDRCETRNLAAEHPDKVKELDEAFQQAHRRVRQTRRAGPAGNHRHPRGRSRTPRNPRPSRHRSPSS